LNAVADADPALLYNTSMGSNARGGITRSGASGSFTYTAKANMGNKPVNFVSFSDAARFANWLHNNQPIGAQGPGTTETGAYTMSASPITREPGATWFLPTEDEWYKAAYHKNDGATGNYWDYPTGVDVPSAPTSATADADGDISNPGANVANHSAGADWDSNGDTIAENGNVTTVGSADDPNTVGIESASPYFTFDQGGNVHEWNEAMPFVGDRGVRGGTWAAGSVGLLASNIITSQLAFAEDSVTGFRVAAVPEPGAWLLVGGVAASAYLVRLLRRKWHSPLASSVGS
jgi:formylglycine-generating enzyme required for sulfatase activity